jgi:hypothetical protein
VWPSSRTGRAGIHTLRWKEPHLPPLGAGLVTLDVQLINKMDLYFKAIFVFKNQNQDQ